MPGPLSGLRIVEMVGLGPAPFAAMMLADAGAEVIRIHQKGARADIPLMNTRFDVLARGRRSIALDLNHSSSRNVLPDSQWLQSSILCDDKSLAVQCSYNNFTSTGELFHRRPDNLR